MRDESLRSATPHGRRNRLGDDRPVRQCRIESGLGLVPSGCVENLLVFLAGGRQLIGIEVPEHAVHTGWGRERLLGPWLLELPGDHRA